MAYGGYHPYPRRFGGGKPQLETIHKSLNAQRGSAYDATTGTTTVSIENMALARAITFDGWGTNDRLGNQWDPARTTDMLSRWEKIFGIRPIPGTPEADRRAEVMRRWERFGRIANHARLTTALSDKLGSFFVAIEYISLANAVVHAPDGSYPWGTAVSGVPWYSTVAHILVLLQKPTGATEGDFYEAAGMVAPILDPILPAWVTFDWYRAPDSGTPVSVSGGPSMGGFYLDNEHNLDNNVFDV